MGVTRFDAINAINLQGIEGAGNIYWVMQTTHGSYSQFKEDHQFVYADGSNSVHTGIQSALDATVANRNDYVIVMPDATDYDITAALTMSKNRVHLVCPAGIGNKGMNNFARIHQTTATTQCIVVTADCVEIAGLFFKGYDGTAKDAPSIIHLSGTRWTPHIHDNFFGIGATASSSNYGILADGACSHFNIHDNYFTNYSPTLLTGTANDVAAFVGITSASSTRGIIADNIMHTGPNTTVASGITNVGTGMLISGNFLWENSAVGSYDAGVLTKGITLTSDGFAVNNRIAVATAANAITGGTVDASANQNFESENGGTVIEVV
jgi:hypothetical protein